MTEVLGFLQWGSQLPSIQSCNLPTFQQVDFLVDNGNTLLVSD